MAAQRLACAAIVSFLLAASFSAWAAKPKTYSLEQLDSAANLLMSTSDGKTQVCPKIAPDEAKTLLLAIHPMIDSRARQTKPKASWVKACEKDCHCGVYASIDPGNEELNKKAAQQSQAALKSCVQKAKWFCNSELLKALRANPIH